MTGPQRSAKVLVGPLVEDIAKRHVVDPGSILGRSRASEVVRARHELWAVTIDTLALGWSEAARLFGRDHSSIMHGYRRHKAATGEGVSS